MIEQLKLDDDEQIFRLVRKHWFILFSKTIGLFFAAVAPFVLIAFASSNDIIANVIPSQNIWMGPAVFLSFAWLLIIWMTLFTVWTDYYLDMWIVTNCRVIAIDQQGFFRRKVASFRLERLQNLTIDIVGIIATFLNFGNITAETAGNTEAFVIRGIPDPRGVKALIQEYADQVVMAPVQSAPQSVQTPVA